MRQVPWVGRIAAGTPILAEEAIEDIIPLPVDIVGTGPVFLLTVKGDSMVGAGILDGDLVVVRSQPDADDGEIVAALVDGEEATVKRLRRRDGSSASCRRTRTTPPWFSKEGWRSWARWSPCFEGCAEPQSGSVPR